MALRGSMLVPSAITRTLVCVNDTSQSEISGELFNPYMRDGKSFRSIKEFLDIMDAFFESIDFPQSYYEFRNFDERKEPAEKSKKPDVVITKYHGDDLYDSTKGSYATFVVQVQFRQSASWQGNVTWREKNQTMAFQSTLELLRLIDDALEASNNNPIVTKW